MLHNAFVRYYSKMMMVMTLMMMTMVVSWNKGNDVINKGNDVINKGNLENTAKYDASHSTFVIYTYYYIITQVVFYDVKCTLTVRLFVTQVVTDLLKSVSVWSSGVVPWFENTLCPNVEGVHLYYLRRPVFVDWLQPWTFWFSSILYATVILLWFLYFCVSLVMWYVVLCYNIVW